MRIGKIEGFYIIIGTVTLLISRILALLNLTWPYSITTPLLVTLGTLLVANGWRLFKLKINKMPYEFRDHLRDFKQYLKEGQNEQALIKRIDSIESDLIGAIYNYDYLRSAELVYDSIAISSCVRNEKIYELATKKIYNILIRYSYDLNILDVSLTTILHLIEFFYSKKFPQGSDRCMSIFGNLCIQNASISFKRLRMISQVLIEISKKNYTFRKEENYKIFYLSLICRVVAKLNTLNFSSSIRDRPEDARKIFHRALSNMLIINPFPIVQKAFIWTHIQQYDNILVTIEEMNKFEALYLIFKFIHLFTPSQPEVN